MAQRDATDDIDTAAATRKLLDIVNGSWMSQATYVAAHLGIPDLLADRTQSAAFLDAALGRLPLVNVGQSATQPDDR